MKLKAKQIIDKYIGSVLVYIHVVLVRAIGLMLRRSHDINAEPENILVIKMLGLGSVIMASDSLYSLRLRYPHSKMILLTGNGVAHGIKPLGLFDEIWIIDDSNIFKLLLSSVYTLFKTWRLRKLWTIDLEVYSALTTLFSTWTLAINRFGFELDKVNFRHYLNTHHVYFNQFIPVFRNYEQLAKLAGVISFVPFAFPYNNKFTIKKSIAINNTCSELGGNLRKLPDLQLSEICSYFIEKGYTIVFTGAPSDTLQIDQFIQNNLPQLKESTVNLAAKKLSFDKYYEYLKDNCCLMLSIDSAPLHIGYKLGLPTVSLWGPISPVQRVAIDSITGPKMETVYLHKNCSPCIHHTEITPCGGNNICMKDMKAEEIIAKMKLLLQDE